MTDSTINELPNATPAETGVKGPALVQKWAQPRQVECNPYWVMHWGDGRPDTIEFEEEEALAIMLADGTCFVNSYHWKSEWPEADRERVAIIVNCNDIFAWACADGEELDHDQIKPLYDSCVAHPKWGSAIWCAIRRSQKPQPPVIRKMKADGVWDDRMEKLGENWQDAETQALFAEYAAIVRNKAALDSPPAAKEG